MFYVNSRTLKAATQEPSQGNPDEQGGALVLSASFIYLDRSSESRTDNLFLLADNYEGYTNLMELREVARDVLLNGPLKIAEPPWNGSTAGFAHVIPHLSICHRKPRRT